MWFLVLAYHIFGIKMKKTNLLYGFCRFSNSFPRLTQAHKFARIRMAETEREIGERVG